MLILDELLVGRVHHLHKVRTHPLRQCAPESHDAGSKDSIAVAILSVPAAIVFVEVAVEELHEHAGVEPFACDCDGVSAVAGLSLDGEAVWGVLFLDASSAVDLGPKLAKCEGLVELFNDWTITLGLQDAVTLQWCVNTVLVGISEGEPRTQSPSMFAIRLQRS